MITNQIMKRSMGEFSVEQRTKDGMFNATELLRQWNSPENLNTQNSGYLKKKKNLDDYLNNKATKEFVDALAKEEKANNGNPIFKTTRGKNGGTWMHPLMFIDFAMWLNPTFKVKVLKFVSDQMIKYRNEAGDAYKQLSSAINRIVRPNEMKKRMPEVAKAINWVVFNKHQQNVRNEFGEEDKQRELFDMERQVAMLIEDGFVHNYDELVYYLRKKYVEKYIPKDMQDTVLAEYRP